jgi:hypothetical protein
MTLSHANHSHPGPRRRGHVGEEVRQSGEPFKQVLNSAIRAGLLVMKPRGEAFEPLTFDMGTPRVDLTRAASLAAELEDDELIDRYRRSR